MKEFIWNFRNMLFAKKHSRHSEVSRDEYVWYKYLIKHDIRLFFSRLGFHKKSEGDLPF